MNTLTRPPTSRWATLPAVATHASSMKHGLPLATSSTQCANHCKPAFFLPTCKVWGCTLYMMLKDRPDLYLAWHNPSGKSGGNCYVQFGCNLCRRKTKFYQPQQTFVKDNVCNPNFQMDDRDAKKHRDVQQSYRVFFGLVLVEPSLMVKEECRFLHEDEEDCQWEPAIPAIPAIVDGQA